MIFPLSSMVALLWGTSASLRAFISRAALCSLSKRGPTPRVSAHGTILLFEDADILAQMQKQFALYAESMENWLQQGNAILSYMIWQCLAEQKVGASLQHYGNLVENDVIEQFHLPQAWRLVAQMPFGGIMAPPAAKEVVPLSERFKVLW